MMVSYGRKFTISILTPGKSLLDCKGSLLKFPAHDGMRGVLYNHCPMLCQMGLGILEVHGIANEGSRYYVVEGGLVRVSENHVRVLAYDATNLRDLPEETAKELVRNAREVVVGKEYIKHQREEGLSLRKARLLVHLAELDNFEISKD